MLIYELIYTLITTVLFPVEMAGVPKYDQIIFWTCFVMSLFVFWACIARPFWWIIKYGIFGGSKKNPLTKK